MSSPEEWQRSQEVDEALDHIVDDFMHRVQGYEPEHVRTKLNEYVGEIHNWTVEVRDPGPCAFCAHYEDRNVMPPIHTCPKDAPLDYVPCGPKSAAILDALNTGQDLDAVLQHR